MGSRWSDLSPKGLPWVPMGSRNCDPSPTEVPWKAHGSPMEAPRKSHGSTTEEPWVLYRFRDVPWKSHGINTEVSWDDEILWKLHGSPMGTPWKYHENLEVPWRNHTEVLWELCGKRKSHANPIKVPRKPQGIPRESHGRTTEIPIEVSWEHHRSTMGSWKSN